MLADNASRYEFRQFGQYKKQTQAWLKLNNSLANMKGLNASFGFII